MHPNLANNKIIALLTEGDRRLDALDAKLNLMLAKLGIDPTPIVASEAPTTPTAPTVNWERDCEKRFLDPDADANASLAGPLTNPAAPIVEHANMSQSNGPETTTTGKV
jgi:hypothetical protein